MPNDTNITGYESLQGETADYETAEYEVRAGRFADDEEFDRLITWALHKHAEETITDEQIQRILAPIHARIAAGEFTKGASATGDCPKYRPHTHRTGSRSR